MQCYPACVALGCVIVLGVRTYPVMQAHKNLAKAKAKLQQALTQSLSASLAGNTVTPDRNEKRCEQSALSESMHKAEAKAAYEYLSK